jgi:hypothetical protein
MVEWDVVMVFVICFYANVMDKMSSIHMILGSR